MLRLGFNPLDLKAVEGFFWIWCNVFVDTLMMPQDVKCLLTIGCMQLDMKRLGNNLTWDPIYGGNSIATKFVCEKRSIQARHRGRIN